MNPTQFSKTPQPNTFKIPFIGGIFNQLKKIGWKLILIIPVVLVLGGMIFLLSFLIEPGEKPQNVYTSNIADSQITISWATTQPTKGIILISQNEKFPLMPIFADLIYKDDGEKRTKTVGRYLTHHVTIGNLRPATNYNYQIYQGIKKVHEGKFMTASILPSLGGPNPVYGQVLDKDKKPVAGVLVYFQALNEGNKSAVLSTLTNIHGRWSLDLGNIRSLDSTSLVAIKSAVTCRLVPVTTTTKTATKSASPQTRPDCIRDPKKQATMEHIIVDGGGSRGRFKAATESGYDKPWPTIILDKK